MFQTKLNPCARSMVADSTTTDDRNGADTGATLICRACLVLLGPQDAAYSLDSEQDLARKYFGCTGGGLGKDEDDMLPQLVVLKSICESCYQLVQKFYAFQCMCEESSRNFKKLLLEIDLYCLKEQEDAVNGKPPDLPETPSESDESTKEEEEAEAPSMESIEEIEEVYIIEDEGSKQDLGKEKVPRTFARNKRTGQGLRRVRHTLDCGICQRGFYKSSLLEAHMKRQHEGVEPYTCVHCDKSYARANLLDSHLREMHCNGGERVTYPCPSCSKVYTAARSLKYHTKRQHAIESSSDSQHICEQCGKSFGRKAHLTRHKWTHKVGERKYPCEYCNQGFHTKENMMDHQQRKHGNKNLLRCRKCGRIFRNISDLSTHIKNTCR